MRKKEASARESRVTNAQRKGPADDAHNIHDPPTASFFFPFQLERLTSEAPLHQLRLRAWVAHPARRSADARGQCQSP